MPRYTVKFEENTIHKYTVIVDAIDEQDAYDKVNRLDFNAANLNKIEDILLKRTVDETSAELVIPPA